MSDHGEEKVNKAFNTNVWLENEGYLKTNIKNKSFLATIGVNRERIFKILDKFKLNFLVKIVPRSFAKKLPTKETDFEEAILTGLIDLKITKAISKRAVKTSQIFLNKEARGGVVKKSEEEILKKEIKSKLEKYFAKNKINVEIKTNEELYGKNSYGAPDITLYMKEKNLDVLSIFSENKKLWDNPREEATHNQEGIIFTDLNLKLNDAKIIDLTPTILDFFNIKGKFDGKSLL